MKIMVVFLPAVLYLAPARVISNPQTEVLPPDTVFWDIEDENILPGDNTWAELLEETNRLTTDSTISIEPSTELENRWNAPGFPFHSIRLRSRMDSRSETPYNGSLFRIDLTQARWGGMLLLQNDHGEQKPGDLTRLALEYNDQDKKLVLGDFTTDSGLGWSIATRPSFPSSYSIDHAFINRSDGIRTNRTSEEGYGWRGLAYSTRIRKLKSSIWAGTMQYDARWEEDEWLPYADQGDHTTDRREASQKITEQHAGMLLSLAGDKGKLTLNLWHSRFDGSLSSESPVRFRNIGQQVQTLGLYWRRKITGQLINELEIVSQEIGVVAGVLRDQFRNDKLKINAQFHYAKREYSTLHARPYVPFTTSIPGTYGALIGLEHRGKEIKYGGWMAHLARFSTGENPSETVSGIRFYLLKSFPGRTFFKVYYSIRKKDGETGVGTPAIHRVRLGIVIPEQHTETRLFAEFAFNRSALGNHATLQRIREWNPRLKMVSSLSFYHHRGTGVSTTLIEPTGPGLMPILRVNNEGFRLSFLVTYKVLPSTKAWIQASLNRERNTDNDDTIFDSDELIRLGFDYRYSLH